MIDTWQWTFDPIQPNKQVAETLRKRAERLRSKDNPGLKHDASS